MAFLKISPKIGDSAKMLADIERANTILRELKDIVYSLERNGIEVEIKEEPENDSDSET
jgi:hypothetical protein